MSMTDGKDELVRGVTASFVAQLLYMVATAALMVALTRYLLTPQRYGLLNYALSVLGVTQVFVGLGIAKSGARYVTEYAETDPGQVRHVLRISLLAMVLLLAVVTGIYALFTETIAGLLDEPDLAPLLFVGIGYLAFYSLGTFVRLVFQAFNRITYSAAVHAIEGVSRLVFAIAFVLLGYGAVGALGGYVAGFLVAILVGGVLFFTRFYPSLERDAEREPGLVRRILRYSVPLTATSGADVLDKRVDVLLVGFLLTPTAVAFYALAKQISSFLIVPASAIDSAIAPRLGDEKARNAPGQGAQIYQRSLRYVLLFYVPVGLGMVLVAEPGVRYVFGTPYLAAVPVIQVFSLFVVINGVNKVTTNSLDYLGRARERAIAKGVTSVANASLNVLLIPVVGVVGAAVATVITHSIYTAMNVYYIHHELPLTLRDLAPQVLGILGITGGMGLVVVTLLPFVSGVFTLVGVIIAGGLVWGLLSLASGLIEVGLLRSALPSGGPAE